MEAEAVITIYQDLRREKQNGTYPVKIRVYDGRGERKYYPTGVDLTEAEFKKVTSGGRLTGDLKKAKDTLDEKKASATKLAAKIDPFDIEAFDRKFKIVRHTGSNIFSYYERKIDELREADQIKTSILYRCAMDSLKRFCEPQTKLLFTQVNQGFLKKYKKYMTDQGKSLTTISMYLRTLRTLFNAAIKEKDISQDIYPFEEDTIPTGANVKQALSKEDLKKLWQFKTVATVTTKAKDFWFFVYNAYGMNIRDVVQLKPSNIIGETIYFVRQKTKNTTKREVIIQVPITKHMRYVIDKYGTNGYYVFDILKSTMTEAEKVRACDSFVRTINDQMEKIAKACGITASCSTYAARHTFGTVAIRNGAPMALIQESFGHQSLSTTQNYFAGYEDVEKRKVSDNLMKF